MKDKEAFIIVNRLIGVGLDLNISNEFNDKLWELSDWTDDKLRNIQGGRE